LAIPRPPRAENPNGAENRSAQPRQPRPASRTMSRRRARSSLMQFINDELPRLLWHRQSSKPGGDKDSHTARLIGECVATGEIDDRTHFAFERAGLAAHAGLNGRTLSRRASKPIRRIPTHKPNGLRRGSNLVQLWSAPRGSPRRASDRTRTRRRDAVDIGIHAIGRLSA
jgi:hypothetical protein